jgi:hypothetical protein
MTAPKVFAEEAMSLLAAEPERLLCGFSDNALWTSRCLIEKCSPHCLQTTFEKLEATLLAFSTPFERSKEGFKARGDASFNLLGALCSARRRRTTTARFEQLERKFGRLQGPPQGIRSYSVVSPIQKESAEYMTDQNWLAAIAKHNRPRAIPDWHHPEKGGAWELAGLLQEFTKREPERFAHLALRFPPETDASYLMNVLYALARATIPSDLRMDVVRRVIPLEDASCTKAALDVLGVTEKYPLPEDMCAFVKRMATEHPDPPGEEGQAGELAHKRDITTLGINSVRGHAAGTIPDLILHDSGYLEVFLQTLEQMVNDRAVSVRSCVASILLAVARYDVPTAMSLFSRLTDAEDRLLGTPHVERFLSLGLSGYFNDLRCYVERMLRSTVSEVARAGGRLACLARLYHAEANTLAEAALSGDVATRLGSAEIAEANLTHPDCTQWCVEALIKLFDDPDREVRVEAARCFWHLWKQPEVPLGNFHALIAAFLASMAFADSPTMLLHALEGTRQQIPEITLDVCERFVGKCAARARDIRTAHAADEATVGTLVFRSYAQFQSQPVRLRALLLIDRMCEEGLHSASKGLLEFER